MLRKVGLVKFCRRSHSDRQLLLEAGFWLALARIAILTVPFRWTIRLLAYRPVSDGMKNPCSCDTAALKFARRAGWALASVSSRTPWRSTCLTEAIAGAGMLRSRQLAATLALGIAKSFANPDTLEAHAWLTCGDLIVTGAQGHTRFRVVARFARY
jgi:hypothetical protein